MRIGGGRVRGRILLLGSVAVLIAAGVAVGEWGWLRGRGANALDNAAVVRVRRADLEVAVVVPGDIRGADQTEIRCEVEAIHADGSAAIGPTIIELVEDGRRVRKDEVLLRFDTSAFEERARRQQIEVERAVSEHRQAELELEVARVALAAYRDGEAIQATRSLQGRIALLRSDLEQARARLTWSGRMRGLGYGSASELSVDEIAARRLEVDLVAAETALRNHLRYQIPKQVRELEVRVERAEEELDFCELQLRNAIKLLEHDREQIERCTVRAPHDGMAIHVAAMYWGDEYRLRVGGTVYQQQPLFSLPDLSRPVVEVSLNQSIARRIQVGMPAEVRIDALPGRVFRGRVESIEQLPTINWRAGWDVLHVSGRVRIENPPGEGLYPLMSAHVRIVTEHHANALVVPAEAVLVQGGRPYCRVARGRGVPERREVVLEPADLERLRVVDGLTEGEWVVLDPPEAQVAGAGSLGIGR